MVFDDNSELFYFKLILLIKFLTSDDLLRISLRNCAQDHINGSYHTPCH